MGHQRRTERRWKRHLEITRSAARDRDNHRQQGVNVIRRWEFVISSLPTGKKRKPISSPQNLWGWSNDRVQAGRKFSTKRDA